MLVYWQEVSKLVECVQWSLLLGMALQCLCLEEKEQQLI